MSKISLRSLRECVDRPMDDRAVEAMVGVAVAIWTFGQLVFVHATVGQLPLVREIGLGACFQAVAFGCLVTAIASRRYELGTAAMVGVGSFLFVAITVWDKLKDARLLALALLVVAARQMDLRRLLRFYVGGAAAALLTVTALAVLGVTTIKLEPSLCFGFSNAKTVACLLMGIANAICIVEDGRGTRAFCVVLCLACAAVTLLVLRVRSYAVYMALVAACVVGRDVLERFAGGLMRHREFGWCMAALPIVLLGLCQDAAKFYPFASFVQGGYKTILGQYGFAATCCLAVVYVRAALLAKRGRDTTLVWLLLCLYLVVCTREATVMYLEFNGMLLFLALGMGTGVLGVPESEAHELQQGDE